MYPYKGKANANGKMLAVGDAITVFSFVAVGSYHHGNTDPLHAVYAAVPFLLGWFVVAPFAGAYGGFPSLRNKTFSLLGTWLVAALLGLGFRSTDLFEGSSPPSFGFVMIVIGGGSLLVWRLGLVRLIRRLA